MSLLHYARMGNLGRFAKNIKELSIKENTSSITLFARFLYCFLKIGSGYSDFLNYRLYNKTSAELEEYVTIKHQEKFYEIVSPAAYKKLDELYGSFDGAVYIPKTEALDAQLEALKNGDLEGIGKCAYNIFESVVLPFHSKAGHIKSFLADAGAVFSMMSGSGPSVFGVFDNENTAQAAAKVLQSENIPVWVCEPIGI